MPPLARATPRLTVTYGTFALSDANGIILNSENRGYTLRETFQDGYFSVECVLRLASPTGNETTDDAAFQALVNAARAALTKRRQKLLVQLNGNTINGGGSGWDPSGSVTSAFLIRAEFEKVGSPKDSARRQTYRFTVQCQLPAESANSYHRDSATKTVTGVNGNRICYVSTTWTASASTSAAAQYAANGATVEAAKLPANLTNGQWVQLEMTPTFDDENVTLEATATYVEVILGLREFRVDVGVDANQSQTVTIAGTYMGTPDGNSARTNYNTNVAGFVSNILTAEGGASLYESKPTPGSFGYDTTGKIFRFSRTYRQIIYPQGTSTDDPNVTEYVLHVISRSSWDRQSQAPSNPVTRLQRARATYTAVIDIGSSGGLDPYALWTAKLQAYVLSAIRTKLGSLSVVIEDQDVDVGLDGNTLTATLDLLVRGGTLLQLQMREKIMRSPALNPWPQGDGKANSFWPYWAPTFKVLQRIAVAEYLPGIAKPVIWGTSPQASGYSFVDTGDTYENVLANLEQGILPPAPCWVPFKDGLDEDFFPASRGSDDSFQTTIYTRIETWLYVASWGTKASLPGIAGIAAASSS